MIEGFEALSELVATFLVGLTAGAVVGFFAGVLRAWRRQ